MSLGRGLELPDQIPDFAHPAPALARAGAAAQGGGFLIEGEHGRAYGDLKGGFAGVDIGGRVIATDVRLEGYRAVNFVASPGTLRRELAGPAGTVLETALAATTLPLVAVRWGAADVDRVLEFALLPGAGNPTYEAQGALVTASPAGDDGERVLAALHGVAAATEVSDRDAGGGLLLRCSIAAGETPTLLLAAGSMAALRGALGGAAHLASHAVRAASPTGVLRSRSGVAEIDDAVDWLGARLAYAARGAWRERPRGPDALWTALGALAAGEGDAVHGLLTRLAEGTAAPALEPVAGILAARLALTTGDRRRARALAHGVLAVPAHPADDPAAALSLRLLADALQGVEATETLAVLRDRAATASARPRALPMAGDVPRRDFLDWGGEGQSELPGATGHDIADRVLEAWALLDQDPEGAWQVWRASLAAGLQAGPAGPGTWDAIDPARTAPGAGALLCFLVNGLWGFVPDAPTGRARLAPVLPGHLTAFAIDGLRVGDAVLGVRYERDDMLHRFDLEPLEGRVPPMIVFEPVLPGERLVEARVDGRQADLDEASRGARRVVKVQLPLDAARRVELVLG